MTRILVAGAACALALALSGCTTAGSTAMAPITNAVAQDLPHCHVWGGVNGSIGGITAPSAGNNLSFDCQAQPWVGPAASGVTVGASIGTPAAPSSPAAAQ